MHHSSELIKQAAAHKAVRDRLFNPPKPAPKAEIKPFDVVTVLREKVAELMSDLAERDRLIRHLELDIADRNARIIAQAEMLAKLDETNDIHSPPKKQISAIVAEVLKDFPGVTWEDVIGVRRTRALVKPRHLCMSAVYEQRKDLSLPVIGKIFKRDHTVVLYAVDKYSERRSA